MRLIGGGVIKERHVIEHLRSKYRLWVERWFSRI
jgi:hypothetical protein